MNKNNSPLLLPFLSFILLIMAFIFCQKYLMPNIAENSVRAEALDTDILEAREKITSLTTASKSISSISATVNDLLIAVPNSIDTPNLITEIETIAKQNQVTLSNITPPTETAEASEATGAEGLNVNVSVSGSFQNLNNFISGLESSIRFSKIQNLTISSSQDGGVTASISFDVYKRPELKLNPVNTTEGTNE